MKKQAIIIYDTEEKKIVQVCEVKDLTDDQFEKLSYQGKVNDREIASKKRKQENDKECAINDTFVELNRQIGNLTKIICHLLGYEELEENEILILLGKKDPEGAEEELIEVDRPFIEPLEEEPHEETSEQE